MELERAYLVPLDQNVPDVLQRQWINPGLDPPTDHYQEEPLTDEIELPSIWV
jgi:hypothetical protein